jgi:hypothetical protein
VSFALTTLEVSNPSHTVEWQLPADVPDEALYALLTKARDSQAPFACDARRARGRIAASPPARRSSRHCSERLCRLLMRNAGQRNQARRGQRRLLDRRVRVLFQVAQQPSGGHLWVTGRSFRATRIVSSSASTRLSCGRYRTAARAMSACSSPAAAPERTPLRRALRSGLGQVEHDRQHERLRRYGRAPSRRTCARRQQRHGRRLLTRHRHLDGDRPDGLPLRLRRRCAASQRAGPLRRRRQSQVLRPVLLRRSP